MQRPYDICVYNGVELLNAMVQSRHVLVSCTQGCLKNMFKTKLMAADSWIFPSPVPVSSMSHLPWCAAAPSWLLHARGHTLENVVWLAASAQLFDHVSDECSLCLSAGNENSTFLNGRTLLSSQPN